MSSTEAAEQRPAQAASEVVAGRRSGRPPGSWRDAAWALGVGGVAFFVYLSTLAPGLIGLIDVPKFQFIGKVLGVPHSPGYPLYVLVSHLFGYLPWGTLAFRINLMSAVFGAIAVSLVFLILRRLGCRPIGAAAVALALALGRVFWSTTVVAEVYSLHAALVAGTILALLTWKERRSPASFFTAVGLVALAFGNHTTIVLLAPALVVFVLLSDARWALRPRILAASAGIVVLGIAQYGFILLRTVQQAPYLESPAWSLRELLDVMRGERWNEQLFEYDVSTLVAERLPFAYGVFLDELTIVGLVLAAVGLVWLLCRRRAEATLLGLAAAGIIVFAVNFRTGEPEVFLLPALMCCWIAVGVGVERVLETIGRLGRLTPLTGVVLLVLPLTQVARNWEANDRSREVEGIRAFDAIFEQLPAHSVFVGEDFVVDRMIDYKVLGEEAQGHRTVRGRVGRRDFDRIDRLIAAGVAVFAFPKRTTDLRWQGFPFAEVPLFEPLAVFLDDLPRGSIVGIAGRLDGVAPDPGTRDPLAVLGVDGWHADPERPVAVVLGVVGADDGAIADSASQRLALALAVRHEIGSTGVSSPARIRVGADRRSAWVEVNGREVVRTDVGAALVVVGETGDLLAAHALDAERGLAVPLEADPLRPFRLMAPRACTHLASGEWTDVSGLAAGGKLIVGLPQGAAVALYAGRAMPLDPLITGTSVGANVGVHVQTFGPAAEDRAALEAALAADGFDAAALADLPHVARVALDTRHGEPVNVDVAVTLGGVPEKVWTSSLGATDVPVPSLCAGTVGFDGLFADSSARRARIDVATQGELFAHGWVAAGRSTAGPARSTNGPEAEVLLPLWRAGPGRIRVVARPSADAAMSGTLALGVNGVRLGDRPIGAGWVTYEWPLPDEALQVGTNQAILGVSTPAASSSDGASSGGVSVRSIVLELSEMPPGRP